MYWGRSETNSFKLQILLIPIKISCQKKKNIPVVHVPINSLNKTKEHLKFL